jgi:ribosomal-protein-alanine N-acetyltransferase
VTTPRVPEEGDHKRAGDHLSWPVANHPRPGAAVASGEASFKPLRLPAPTLPTARLCLRPVAGEDADALFALHTSPHVLRYWDAAPWTEREQAERFVATCRQMAEEGSGARLAVERVSDGAFIGWCALNRWNPEYRSASLGYCLADAAWGHGYATEAASALLQWAFDTLDLNRVQAETDTRNAASARVLEKLNFMREGTLREDCVVNGEVSDSWVYGLVRREWRAPSLQA